MEKLYDERYHLTELLGNGTTAKVYRAEDLETSREVALKILDETHLNEGDTLKLFEREIKAVARLERHPNLLNYYGGSLKDGYHYLVMDVADGETLTHYLNRMGGKLSVKEALSIFSQLITALSYIHKRGVIHRDIKPQNIRMSSDGSLKLCDFGIAVVTGLTVAGDGKAVGTVNYISPEQARGGEVTPASDLYSASVVFYELLTGVLPFTSDKTSPEDRIGEIIRKHLKEPPIRPSHYNPNIPEALEQIILKGMAKNPLSRFASAEEILKYLAIYTKMPAIEFDFDLPDEEFDTSAALPKYTAPHAFKPRVKVKEREEKDKKPKGPKKGLTHGKLLLITLFTVLSILAAAVIYAAVHSLFFFENTDRKLLTRGDLLYRPYTEELILSLEEEGYTVTLDYAYSPYHPSGTVIAQKPLPQSVQELTDGERPMLHLTISRERTVSLMEDTVGKDYRLVKKDLEARGYRVTLERRYASEAVGTVIDASPAVGEAILDDSPIRLTVSIGKKPRYAYVPNLIGLSLVEAKARLAAADIPYQTVYVDSDKPKSVVLSQSRPYGEKLLISYYDVILTVSNGALTPPTTDSTAPPVDTTPPEDTTTRPEDSTFPTWPDLLPPGESTTQ